MAAQGATAFFSFASVWLITKTLGSEGYGGIVAIIAASQVIQIFLSWSITSLARFGIEEFVETGKITKSFWTRSLIFFPNAVVILLTSGFWLVSLSEWLKIPASATRLIVIHFIAAGIWLHVQYAMQGAKRLRSQSILLAFERGLTCLFLLALIAGGQIVLEDFIWCYILPTILISVVGLILLRPFIEFNNFYDYLQFRKMLIYSLPLIPFAIIGYLSTSQLDAIFITQFLSKRDLGIYSIATQINGITLQLPILANTILLSMFVSLKTTGKDSLVTQIFREVVPTLTLAWGFLCTALGFICVFLIPLTFGQEFETAAKSLWILLSASVITFPILTGFATLSNTYSKTYISMYAAILMAVSNIFFNTLLIPKFGMTGCAWATVTASLVSLMVFYFLLKREKLLSESWVFQAVLPAVGSAFVYSLNLNAWWALLVCTFLTFSVAYLHIDSLQETYRVLKRKLNK